MLGLLAATVLVALVGGSAAGAAGGGGRLPGPQLVLHPTGPAAHRRRAPERAGAARLRRRRRRRGDRGRPGLAPGSRGHPGPHRGRDHGRPVPLGAHRPGHRRGDRGPAARDLRPGRRLAAGAKPRPAGGWWPPAALHAPRRPTRATPGCASTTTTCWPCAESRCGRPTSGCSRRSPCRPRLVLEYRRLRERDERAAALESAEATSTAVLRAVSHDLRTPLATMRRRRSTVWSPATSPDDGPARAGRLGRVVDRPARAADRQPARPVPAADAAC